MTATALLMWVSFAFSGSLWSLATAIMATLSIVAMTIRFLKGPRNSLLLVALLIPLTLAIAPIARVSALSSPTGQHSINKDVNLDCYVASAGLLTGTAGLFAYTASDGIWGFFGGVSTVISLVGATVDTCGGSSSIPVTADPTFCILYYSTCPTISAW